MSVSIKSLGLDHLTPDERILLAEELWESVSAEFEGIPLTDGQRADLERRLDASRDNPQAGSTWDEVETRLRGDT